jgi:hypothetical protein
MAESSNAGIDGKEGMSLSSTASMRLQIRDGVSSMTAAMTRLISSALYLRCPDSFVFLLVK